MLMLRAGYAAILGSEVARISGGERKVVVDGRSRWLLPCIAVCSRSGRLRHRVESEGVYLRRATIWAGVEAPKGNRSIRSRAR